MTSKIGFEGNSLFVGATKTVTGFGNNILTDPGLEAWTTFLQPTNWELGGFAPGSAPSISTDAYSGTYSAEFSGGGGTLPSINGISYLSQTISGLNSGDSYTPKIFAKGNGKSVFISALSPQLFGNDDGVYNFTGPDAGTYTQFAGSFSSDQYYLISSTGSWVQYTGTPFLIASNGNLNIIVASFDTGVFVDDVSILKNGTGPDIAINGGFETETVTYNLTNYTNVRNSGAILTRESVNVHGGNYAAKLMTVGGATARFYQQKTGLTPGAQYRASFWASAGTLGDSGQVYVANGGDSDNDQHTQIYNWNTQQWENNAGSPSNDQIFNVSPTVAYQQFVSPTFQAPANGNITIIFASSNEAQIIYYDDLLLELYAIAPLVTLFDLVNQTDATNLETGDYVWKIRTTGGTEKVHIAMKNNGYFTTDYNTFNFTNKETVLADLTVYGTARPSNDIIFNDASKGIILKDSNSPAHYWRITIDISGALITTDLGTVSP